MNIIIAVVASSAEFSGISRHAVNMAKSLLIRSEICTVHLVIGKWQYQSFNVMTPQGSARLHVHAVDIGTNTLCRNFWYYYKLPIFAAKLEADAVHLAYPTPLRRRAYTCPVVVTLHDLYPYDMPANFGYIKVIFNRLILKQCLSSIDAIACVSDSTLRQLDIYFPNIALSKAVMIYNCVEPGPPMATIGPLRDWDGEGFILCVAQHRRNKNILLALRVFHRLLLDEEIDKNAKLVIVGIPWPGDRKY